ncbi:KilA-N domain-containing protein [Salmonella enterica]|nr:KilA-N domain-containing protein [Salmonella enterica]
MTKAKTISLFWNNKLHTITADNEGRFNLNDLHRISEFSASKRPGNWKLYVTDLIDKYSTASFLALKTVNGGSKRGTYAIEELMYAYAMYLSTEFHKAVLDAFTAAVSGNMVKVREIVRTAVRQEGVPNSS